MRKKYTIKVSFYVYLSKLIVYYSIHLLFSENKLLDCMVNRVPPQNPLSPWHNKRVGTHCKRYNKPAIFHNQAACIPKKIP